MVHGARDFSYRDLIRQTDVLPDEVVRLTSLITACELVDEPESVLDEFAPRSQAIQARMWPSDPLAGFAQQSSVGAFLVARYAGAWVPEGLSTRRHAALAPEGLVKALVEGGLGRPQAELLVGPWPGAEAEPPPDAGPLDIGRLAALAERSSTRSERDEALTRVAWSPRDLARLAAAARLIDRVRSALPWAPARDLTPGLAIAAVDVAHRAPERRLRLLAGHDDPWLRAIVELAETEVALRRNDAPAIERLLAAADEDPDTADLPERNTRDDLPVLSELEAQADPRGACVGLRPRRGDLHAHDLPGSDVGEGALLAAVRALRFGTVLAAEGRPPKDAKSKHWNRRLEGFSSAVSGDFDGAVARLETTDPERRWLEPVRLRGRDHVAADTARAHGADIVRDVTASLLQALSGETVGGAE